MKYAIYPRGAPRDTEPLAEYDTFEEADTAYRTGYEAGSVEIRRTHPNAGAFYPGGVDLHLPE